MEKKEDGKGGAKAHNANELAIRSCNRTQGANTKFSLLPSHPPPILCALVFFPPVS